jgi:CHASE3 domain sensor protein
VPILLFFIFIAAVVFFILALGYGLSSLEEKRSSTRRCRRPQEAHYRRKTRTRRCKGRSGRVL